MEPFTVHTGVVVILDRANVDTDAIIPKQFLKSIRRTGFEDGFFYDWRFRPDGTPDPDFPLNAETAAGASILVAGNNFGCGSSREHAVWAVLQYGFRVVIAPRIERGDVKVPGFADIFRNNAGKNGLLTIELSPEEVARISELFRRAPGSSATVDLFEQTITCHVPDGDVALPFEIDPGLRDRLLGGFDEIALTLLKKDDIGTFEKTYDPRMPDYAER